MGALVTLQLPDGSPVFDLPWIITFGPLGDDEDWEPVVSGPYERAHALALAESVVADDDLMAVVEPVLPHVSADEIRGEIAAARMAVEDEDVVDEDGGSEYEDDLLAEEDVEEDGPVPEPPSPEEIRAGMARIAARLTEA